jgi:hypothetical protein
VGFIRRPVRQACLPVALRPGRPAVLILCRECLTGSFLLLSLAIAALRCGGTGWGMPALAALRPLIRGIPLNIASNRQSRLVSDFASWHAYGLAVMGI